MKKIWELPTGSKRTYYYIRALLITALIATGCQKVSSTPTNPSPGGGGWVEAGNLNANGGIAALCTDPSGNIYAAGAFTNDSSAYYVAKWNGTSWSRAGYLDANGVIDMLVTDKSGNLYAAGSFTNAADMRYIAKWNGIEWSDPGIHTDYNMPITICIDPYENLYAAGAIENSSGLNFVYKWNGFAWSNLGSYNTADPITSLCADASTVYASYTTLGGAGAPYVARWNGTWDKLPDLNTNEGIILTSFADANGNLYLGGDFQDPSGKYYMAVWNGSSWSEYGNLNGAIASLTTDDNGYIYAAGSFTIDNYGYAVAVWENGAWAELGNLNAGMDILAITTNYPGKIYAGGNFRNNFGTYYVAEYTF